MTYQGVTYCFDGLSSPAEGEVAVQPLRLHHPFAHHCKASLFQHCIAAGLRLLPSKKENKNLKNEVNKDEEVLSCDICNYRANSRSELIHLLASQLVSWPSVEGVSARFGLLPFILPLLSVFPHPHLGRDQNFEKKIDQEISILPKNICRDRSIEAKMASF